MYKGLITITLCASLAALTACSGKDKKVEDVADSWSIVHKPTIQQGSVLTHEMLDQLQPGMSKEQVRFLLGTPSLVDVFHQDRWDYVYWLKKPGEAAIKNTLSLNFVDGLLTEIEGDYQPGVAGESEAGDEVFVDVPDNSGSKGIFSRTLESVGLKD